MSWSFISSDKSSKAYELRHDGRSVLTLTINSEIGTMRVDGEDDASKRIFVVRREGFWKNKLVLRNEYGVKVGQIIPDDRSNQHGTLEMENDTYHYECQTEGDAPVFTISSLTSTSPLISFRLLQKTGKASAAFLRKGMDTISSELLMAFCWHNESQLRDSVHTSPQAVAI